MSRWQKRSKEDQERILKEQHDQKDNSKKEWKRQCDISRTDLETKGENPNELYEKGDIPIMCQHCGWQGSEHYEIVTDVLPLGMVTLIKGRCRRCGKGISRVLPGFSVESFTFSLTAGTLQKSGRLVDKRPKEGDNNVRK